MRKRDRTCLTASVALLQEVDAVLARTERGKWTARERRFMRLLRAMLRRVLCELAGMVGRKVTTQRV
jgi:hypothetical protein